MKSLKTPSLLIIAIFMFNSHIFAQNWQLVWQDEFTNGISADWNFEVNGNGGGNNELQYYRQENASVQNGSLVITAKQENFGGKAYTSARMTTQNKKSWKFGKIEARIASPSIQGIWPAFWMLGGNIGSVGWPKCGEIDIMEHVNTGNTNYGTIHWNSDADTHVEYSGNTQVNDITQYHTYTVEWDANLIKWFVDGVKYHEANIAGGVNSTSEFQNDFFIILNVAVGGNWPGNSIGAMPANMYVDYIRVYQDGVVTIPPTTDVITVYKDCNYSGFSSGLTIGDYNLAKLKSLGMDDDAISSLKITQGYKAILYQDDNFGGATTTISSDNSCLNTLWNDKVTSIRILANGATDVAGTYLLQNKNSALYMDVVGATSNDGDNIAQGNYNGGTNQQFKFTHLGDGVYQVLAVHSNKSIDIEAIKTNDGANLQQWTYFGSGNQQFIVVPTGDGYYKLIAKHSGKVIEVAGAGMANGNNIQQWTNNNQTCGQWKFKPLTSSGSGTGLRGNYFNGMNFDNPKYSRTDATINFNWANSTPNAAINVDQFSARWTGQIQPKYSEEYTFYITSDNGRRLWVNNQLVIDKWLNDVSENIGKITLVAGQRYEIKLEYFEDNGGATCKMEWSSFMQDREIIPQSQLYANALPTVSISIPNQTYNAPASISITTSTADSDGSISKVEYYSGNTKLGEKTSTPFTYNWTSVAQGNYVVTAIAYDNRGAVTVSSPVNVVVALATGLEIETTESVSIHPNPVAENLNIVIPSSWTNVEVRIVDLIGKDVFINSNFTANNINFSQLSAGVYTISIKSNENVFRYKVIKE